MFYLFLKATENSFSPFEPYVSNTFVLFIDKNLEKKKEKVRVKENGPKNHYLVSISICLPNGELYRHNACSIKVFLKDILFYDIFQYSSYYIDEYLQSGYKIVYILILCAVKFYLFPVFLSFSPKYYSSLLFINKLLFLQIHIF